MTTLARSQADDFFTVEKRAKDADLVLFQSPQGKAQAHLVSMNGPEEFVLDVNFGRMNLSKSVDQLESGSYQLRMPDVIILRRLDCHGRPHMNPDESKIDCPHLRVYTEGFNDKWAFPVPKGIFSNLSDHWRTLHDFMRYCSVNEFPNFGWGGRP